MSLRILSLFIRYGDTDYPGAYQALMAFYARLPELQVESVLIDTALPAGVEVRLGRQTLMMAGDNRRREFSGWDTALTRVSERLDEFDLVHLVTSAFQNEYNGFYPLVSKEMLEYVRDVPGVMLAHVDAYPERVGLLGRSFQTWGCSKFLFARPADLRALETLVAPFEGSEFFPATGNAPFRDGARLSANYARFLLDWLTGDGLPHGQWHSVFAYSGENVAKFRAKALSILDEHNFSMRVRESGVRIVDFTWWHANRGLASVMAPPNELTQVQDRNRYLFGVPLVEGSARPDLPWPGKPGLQALIAEPDGTAPFEGPLVVSLCAGSAVPDDWPLLTQNMLRAGLLRRVGYRFRGVQKAWLLRVDENLAQDTPLPITHGLRVEWLARDDVRQAIDLRSPSGRRELLVWWCCARRTEPALCELIDRAALCEADPGLIQDAPLPVTRGLHAEWLAREDLRHAMDLQTRRGREALIAWWCRAQRAEPSLRTLMEASVLCEVAPHLAQDAPLPITRGLHAEWLAREDLRHAMDLQTRRGREALVAWWCRAQRAEPSLRTLMEASVLCEVAPHLAQDAPLPITRGLRAEWLAREDLRHAMDLQTRWGREALVAWWCRAQRAEPSLRTLMEASVLCEVAPDLVQDAPLPITRGLHAEWLARDDLRAAFDLETVAGRAALAVWWFVTSRADACLARMQRPDVLSEAAYGQQGPRGLSRLEYLLWCSRDDLRAAFDPNSTEGLTAYQGWLVSDGQADVAALAGRGVGCAVPVPAVRGRHEDGGVNVLGYGRGEFGIGEDVRMAVSALATSPFEVCVPRLPLGVAARMADFSARSFETLLPVYRTNLICLPHYETLRLLAATSGDVLDRRYNIAFWQWELARFPYAMRCAFEVVDEIWSASAFTAQAMTEATDKPVRQMPMVVTLPQPAQSWTKADFGLHDDAFVFLTVLDGHSTLKRKNPLATLRAFLRAFPREAQVCLVVKAMNVSVAQPEWRELTALADSDARVRLVVETMTKDRLVGLQSVCDAFVSLHRSEGFGRNIAEAMLLGKPVVVSDYSGNRDFTREDTAFLVEGRLVPLATGDYALGDGQSWFEADEEAAVCALRRCFDDAGLRAGKARSGQAFIQDNYAPAVVGEVYARYLAAFA